MIMSRLEAELPIMAWSTRTLARAVWPVGAAQTAMTDTDKSPELDSELLAPADKSSEEQLESDSPPGPGQPDECGARLECAYRVTLSHIHACTVPNTLHPRRYPSTGWHPAPAEWHRQLVLGSALGRNMF